MRFTYALVPFLLAGLVTASAPRSASATPIRDISTRGCDISAVTVDSSGNLSKQTYTGTETYAAGITTETLTGRIPFTPRTGTRLPTSQNDAGAYALLIDNDGGLWSVEGPSLASLRATRVATGWSDVTAVTISRPVDGSRNTVVYASHRTGELTRRTLNVPISGTWKLGAPQTLTGGLPRVLTTMASFSPQKQAKPQAVDHFYATSFHGELIHYAVPTQGTTYTRHIKRVHDWENASGLVARACDRGDSLDDTRVGLLKYHSDGSVSFVLVYDWTSEYSGYIYEYARAPFQVSGAHF